MIKTAKALAALDGRKRARKEDLERAARYVLPHRMRKNPLDTGEMDPEPMERILAGKPKEKSRKRPGRVTRPEEETDRIQKKFCSRYGMVERSSRSWMY